jgi:hypothetical protein
MQRKILFITGDTLSPSSLEFLAANHLPFLAKPFLVEELKLAVRQQLSKKDSSARSMLGKTISNTRRRNTSKQRPTRK